MAWPALGALEAAKVYWGLLVLRLGSPDQLADRPEGFAAEVKAMARPK